MHIKWTIYKLKAKLCRLLFSDVLENFRESDYELGYSDGYSAGYSDCKDDFNLN